MSVVDESAVKPGDAGVGDHGYSFSPVAGATWRPTGAGFEARDMGLYAASGGRLDVHHLRRSSSVPASSVPASLGWRGTGLPLDCFYVFAGSLMVEQSSGGDALTLTPGDVMHHVAGCACRFSVVSDSCELFAFRDVPDEAAADELDWLVAVDDGPGPDTISGCSVLKDVPESYVLGGGPRSFFEYRDLQTSRPTAGRIHLHVVQWASDEEPPEGGTFWHTHSMAQWFIVVRGHGEIGVEHECRQPMRRGDCMTIGNTVPHNEFTFSKDYHVIQLCTPAEYETLAVDEPAGWVD